MSYISIKAPVVPAKAGTQPDPTSRCTVDWIPAFAGMTAFRADVKFTLKHWRGLQAEMSPVTALVLVFGIFTRGLS